MNNKQCANCKQIKPLDEFFKNPTGSNGRGCYCKKCHLERKQAARKEKKGYYGSEKIKETDKKYREENHDHIKNKSKIRHSKKKKSIITHYGNGKTECVKCGYSDMRALSINHIQSNGAEHRKQIGRGSLYQWLLNHYLPDGFQTLCMNCQWIKRCEKEEHRKRKTSS